MCQISLKKSITKMYDSTLLALLEGGWVTNFEEKSVRKKYDSTLLVLRGGGVSNFQGKALRKT